MVTIILSLFSSSRQGFRTRAALHAEILALRHQLLLVLQRSSCGHRLRLARADRLLWVWLSRFWSGWQSALAIIKTETVIAWHRQGFRLYWRWKSRHPEGRPYVSCEVIDLIRKMSLANPRWGAPRIHGGLLKLGFELSQVTAAKYMVRHRRPPSQTWRTFLQNHVRDLVAVDFFLLRGSHGFLRPAVCLRDSVARPASRGSLRRDAHPTAESTARQLLEAFPWDSPPRYLLCDRDKSYGEKFAEAANGWMSGKSSRPRNRLGRIPLRRDWWAPSGANAWITS